MRKLLDESFKLSRNEAIAALRRRWASTRYVQDMLEIKARLDGELTKDGAGAGQGFQLLILRQAQAQDLHPRRGSGSVR